MLQRILLVMLVPALAAAFVWWTTPHPTASEPAAAASSAPAESAAATWPQEFKVVAARAGALDGRNALVLDFSRPLDPRTTYDDFLTVTGPNGETVRGAWVVGGDEHLSLYFPGVEPDSEYRVVATDSLPDASGHSLGTRRKLAVKTAATPPVYGFASDGAVLPAAGSDGLPVMTINVPAVDIQFLRVKPERLPEFLARYRWSERTSAWRLDDMADMLDSVYSGRFVTAGKPNARTVSHIPVSDIQALQPPGLYLAVLTRPGEFSSRPRTAYFFVTDIGLHARVYEDGLQVYTNSLATAKPLAGVELSLQRLDHGRVQRLGAARTNAEGVAAFDAEVDYNNTLIAHLGNQVAMLSFRQPALDLSGYAVDGAEQQPLEAFVWGPRDLYRPGATVPVSILLRDGDGREVAPRPLTTELYRPDGRLIDTAVLKPGDDGYYSQRLDLPKGAPTGLWRLTVRAHPKAEPLADYRFHVEQFLPERMELALSVPADHLAPGQTMAIHVEGDYLYGAPAAGNRVGGSVTMRAEDSPLERWADYHFGPATTPDPRREALPEAHLDDNGETTLKLTPVAEAAADATLWRACAVVDLYETGGRTVTRAISRLVWPAPTLIGINPLFKGSAQSESAAVFELIKAGPDGALQAGRADITLVREQRDYFWQYTQGGGWRQEYTETDVPVSTSQVELSDQHPAKVALPVKQGRYRLDVTDPATGKTSSYRFYAGWYGADEQAGGPAKVALIPDRDAYSPGDTIHLQVRPPHAGQALILVEADRLLWRKRLAIPATGATVDIPVGDWHRHDIYISAVVFRPGSAHKKITPRRAIGLLYLPLERSARKLDVAIAAPKKMEPEHKLPITVTIGNTGDKTAHVTIAAVDVGVLNITGFETPAPFADFFAKRRYSVDAYDLYGEVIEYLAGQRARLRFGGDVDTASLRGALASRARVRIVSLYSGAVAVDADGEAQLSLPIPDFNGRLRLMAVAWTDQRFGHADAKVTVAAPLVAQIGAPRFLAAGDESTLALDLNNVSGSEKTVALAVTAQGPIAVGAVPRTITLADGERKRLAVALTATGAFGVGRLRLRVSGDGIAVDRSRRIEVRPAYPAGRTSHWQKLAAGATLVLGTGGTEALVPASVRRRLLVAARPPLDLAGVVKGLLGYPYGCLEQTVSRALPLLYLDTATLDALGLEPIPRDKRVARVREAIARVAGMQLHGGGFALWPGDYQADPWLSAYATDFLLRALAAGYAVPQPVLDTALENLQQRLQSGDDLIGGDDAPAHLALAAKAYAGYLLARHGSAPLGTLRTLFDHQRGAAKSGLPLVHLGLALVLEGDHPRGARALAQGAKLERQANAWLGDYGSAVRDTARIIALLRAHADVLADAPALAPLVHRLVQQLRAQGWLSTQDRAAVFAAARGLRALHASPWQASLGTGPPVEAISSAGGWARVVDIDALRTGIAFTSRSKSPLYTRIETIGYPKTAPEPSASPIHIQRHWYDLDGHRFTGAALEVGKIIVAHIAIRAPQHLPDTLVVDLAPAGFEVVNLNLTKGRGLQDVLIEGIDPQAAMRSLRHQSYGDDRYTAAIELDADNTEHLFYLLRAVTPGRYTV
ncbi:MAG: alpha-2-macroglobulin family protein, partial [Salinisphaera sp.]|nr:alpha-2-macroglobulin family protein [Salinisphaera sp.]